VHDVTQIKENELRLQDLVATKDKLFSIIAHDLKNPFHGIIGLADMMILNADNHTPERRKLLISGIRQSAFNAFRLLEVLLEWANSQTGRIEFKPKQMLLSNMVDEVIEQSESTARNKKIVLKSRNLENIQVYADENMIRTVLRNLVSNAIKFTHEGGWVIIRSSTNDQWVEISVSDSGIGIEPQNIDKLFRISEKFSSLGTANETGTGLGLMLCKEFVEKNGGKIWVESQPGLGSSFIFTLPASRPNSHNTDWK